MCVPARQVLFDDVVLGGPAKDVVVDALVLGGRDVERQQPDGGRVDGHRRVHLVERQPIEKGAHVADVRNRNPDLADLSASERIVGVVAGLGGQIEGDAEPGLAFREVGPIELVRCGGRAVARVGPHDPRFVALSLAVLRHWPVLSSANRPRGPKPTSF